MDILTYFGFLFYFFLSGKGKVSKKKIDFHIAMAYNSKVMLKFTTVKIVRAAIIAAIYSTVTIFVGFLSYGPVQIRFAEALTILPLLFPEAIIGVTVGCLISNIFSAYGFLWVDTVFGTLATLAAAVLTYYIGKIFRLGFQQTKKSGIEENAFNGKTAHKEKKAGVFVAALPPVLVNAFVVPFIILSYGLDIAQEGLAVINIFTSDVILLYLLCFVSVFIGQAIAVYGIGIPFYYGVKKSMRVYGNYSLNKGAQGAPSSRRAEKGNEDDIL